MGTEHRRPAHEYLPPNPKPYDYIVFRATEVKDLNVERHATDMQTAMLDNDPAIIGVSTTTYTLPFFSLLPSTPPFASFRNLHHAVHCHLSPLHFDFHARNQLVQAMMRRDIIFIDCLEPSGLKTNGSSFASFILIVDQETLRSSKLTTSFLPIPWLLFT